ncbi:hypothetical protein ACHAPJ_006819 [Fusarium lateritium]
MATGLISGGPVSLVYGAIVAAVGSICSAMSLAELASTYPTAGGQYHFVAHLSSESVSRVSSWFAGYITTFGWITVAGSAPFLAGTMIQGLLVLNYPETYVYERWHGTLLYWSILVVASGVCILCNRILPLVEKVSMTLHVALFLVILVVMCAVSPTKNSATYVFTTFENNSGWSNDGAAWCIGMLSSCYVLIGYDGATHLSEEMQNPETGVPYAMVGSVVLNGLLGFAFLIALLFCMGDMTAALETTTGFPIIEIFYNITGSIRASTAMSSAVVLMASLATIPLLASAARVIMFSLFPPYQPVTPENMNYASLELGATLLFGLVYWPLSARKKYAGALDATEGVAAAAHVSD